MSRTRVASRRLAGAREVVDDVCGRAIGRSIDRSIASVRRQKWRGAATSRFVPAFFLTTIAMKWLVCHLAVER